MGTFGVSCEAVYGWMYGCVHNVESVSASYCVCKISRVGGDVLCKHGRGLGGLFTA